MRKKLGQHFLKNQNIVDLICSNLKEDVEIIIEVGPGKGILTRRLISTNLPVIPIEKDTRFEKYLAPVSNQIIWNDALKVDMEQICNSRNTWLVSNLPYNMATVLLIKFLKIPCITYMTLMVQKEVGFKIVKQMGSLMTLCQTYFQCEALAEISPENFSPPPKVDSLLIGFQRKTDPVISLNELSHLESFSRILFSKKRKQVWNVLKGHYPEKTIERVLDKLHIDKRERAESFDLNQVQQLYCQIWESR